jgi:hypothetical protein
MMIYSVDFLDKQTQGFSSGEGAKQGLRVKRLKPIK